ncbi:shTK domain protein, partial [Teladorsagia circumcincta]
RDGFLQRLEKQTLAWKDGIIPYEMDPAFYRDEHIHIRWDNILPGMKSQFDKISAALQDTQGEKYDYRSIMHYDSTAFSRNGKNTIETVVDGFTDVIGSSVDLSELDIVKGPIECIDHFTDCPHFKQYCQRASFFFVMKSYCPLTCGHCEATMD